MPAYTQIQAYRPYDEQGFPDFLNSCSAVLRELGVEDSFVEAWPSGIEWEVADNGFVDSGSQPEFVGITVCGTAFRIRPMVMGWTKDVYPQSTGPWLSFEILFVSDDLEEADGRYRQDLQAGLWAIMTLVSEHFPDSGVFLTDEVQDGRPFEGLVENNPSTFFCFDCALIPEAMAARFNALPSGFMQAFVYGRIAIIRMWGWHSIPWQNESL